MLIFDYILGGAEGLDAKASMLEREVVLKLIKKNFKVKKGHLNFHKTMGLTIAQKI